MAKVYIDRAITMAHGTHIHGQAEYLELLKKLADDLGVKR